MSDWQPTLYSRFEDERTRPAAELLARVPTDRPRRIADLGCGPGNSTELLAARYRNDSLVTGVDSSEAMLGAARKRLPDVKFEQADIAQWRPVEPLDLIYANASLQWVPDHETLFPRLLSFLKAEGALAAQLPDNLTEPSHRLMRDTARTPPFASLLQAAAAQRTPILPAQRYYDLLAEHADVDIWRTTYYHRMPDAGAIVQWFRSTGLRPYLDPLTPELQARFLAEYERCIEAAYPAQSDGMRLLAFPRLFIVARRR